MRQGRVHTYVAHHCLLMRPYALPTPTTPPRPPTSFDAKQYAFEATHHPVNDYHESCEHSHNEPCLVNDKGCTLWAKVKKECPQGGCDFLYSDSYEPCDQHVILIAGKAMRGLDDVAADANDAKEKLGSFFRTFWDDSLHNKTGLHKNASSGAYVADQGFAKDEGALVINPAATREYVLNRVAWPPRYCRGGRTGDRTGTRPSKKKTWDDPHVVLRAGLPRPTTCPLTPCLPSTRSPTPGFTSYTSTAARTGPRPSTPA